MMRPHRISVRTFRNLFSLGLLPTLLILTQTLAWSAGAEYERRANDLKVNVDYRWVGTSEGGYYPIRIRIQNHGPACAITAQFHSPNTRMPVANRSLTIEQNETASFTLPIPMVGEGSYGKLDFHQNGRIVDDLSNSVTLPESNNSDIPSLLVISSARVNCDEFDSAARSLAAQKSPTSPYGHSFYASPGESYQILAPSALPENWIDYSGLDLVAIDLKELSTLPQQKKSALLRWTQTGGTLIVYNVGSGGPESPEKEQLTRLLQLNQHRSASTNWEPAKLHRRKVIKIVDENGNVFTASMPTKPPKKAASSGDFLWPNSSETFKHKKYMLGSIYAFVEDPFPGTPHDWAWFLSSVGPAQYLWRMRHGMSPRQNDDEFLQFLVPNIKRVPVYSFLTLITLFAIIIGPVNYFYFWRRKQLFMLVVSIPLFAFITSFVLFGYSIISHGFDTKSRVRSFTVLDQGSQTAITMTRFALYSGMAPGEGLSFSTNTAVYPIWPPTQTFDSGTVDWTDKQRLQSGWFRSRSHTQFYSTNSSNMRSRLNVSELSSGNLPIENGLEWNIKHLIVTDDNGKNYSGNNIPAGASTVLEPMNEEALRRMVNNLDENRPEFPDGVSGRGPNTWSWLDFGASRRRYYAMSHNQTATTHSNGLMERTLNAHRQAMLTGQKLPPHSYLAILESNPSVEIGVKNTNEVASFHVLIGYY